MVPPESGQRHFKDVRYKLFSGFILVIGSKSMDISTWNWFKRTVPKEECVFVLVRLHSFVKCSMFSFPTSPAIGLGHKRFATDSRQWCCYQPWITLIYSTSWWKIQRQGEWWMVVMEKDTKKRVCQSGRFVTCSALISHTQLEQLDETTQWFLLLKSHEFLRGRIISRGIRNRHDSTWIDGSQEAIDLFERLGLVRRP